MMRTRIRLFLLLLTMCLAVTMTVHGETVQLRYAHMNPPDSIAGIQATLLANLVAKKTKGALQIRVYPDSQFGTIREQAEAVSKGVIDIHHNTMAGIGSLCDEFNALDTPYLYRDVKHLLKVTSPASPLMARLSTNLIKAGNVRVFYTFYFGARDLTCDRPVYNPKDLNQVKIRAIPFPMYMTTVEGMGATAIPIDFADVPTALATGSIHGQENPVDTIYAAKLYNVQKYLMLTRHILGSECVVFNEKTWNRLSPEYQKALVEAAGEISAKATAMTEKKESELIKELKKKGMKVIGAKEGLDVEAFKARVGALIAKRFNSKYGALYQEIRAVK